MTESSRRVSLFPLLVGVFFILAAIATVIWMYANLPRNRTDSRTEAAKVSRIATQIELDMVRDRIDDLSADIDNPGEPFERINRREALKKGMTAAEYEAGVAANRQARVAELSEKRAALIKDRDRLKAQLDAPLPGRSFNEWLSGYEIIFAMVPFTLLGVYVLRAAMANELPDRNPAGLTDPNRRGMLVGLAFFLFAVTVVVVGLAVIVNS